MAVIRNLIRPSMKIDDHPEHNMPPSEHDGTVLKDQSRYGDNRSDLPNSAEDNSYDFRDTRPQRVSPGYDTGQRMTVRDKSETMDMP